MHGQDANYKTAECPVHKWYSHTTPLPHQGSRFLADPEVGHDDERLSFSGHGRTHRHSRGFDWMPQTCATLSQANTDVEGGGAKSHPWQRSLSIDSCRERESCASFLTIDHVLVEGHTSKSIWPVKTVPHGLQKERGARAGLGREPGSRKNQGRVVNMIKIQIIQNLQGTSENMK